MEAERVRSGELGGKLTNGGQELFLYHELKVQSVG